MNKTDFIQKRVAFFLLVVFALSTTPKLFFHEALAHHSDGLVCQHSGKALPCFHTQTFHCAFVDLVVTSVYLPEEQKILSPVPVFGASVPSLFASNALPLFFLARESRGPPLL